MAIIHDTDNPSRSAVESGPPLGYIRVSKVVGVYICIYCIQNRCLHILHIRAYILHISCICHAGGPLTCQCAATPTRLGLSTDFKFLRVPVLCQCRHRRKEGAGSLVFWGRGIWGMADDLELAWA